MSDLNKRCDTYVNLDNADPRAIGLIAELRAHLKAANKGAEYASNFSTRAYRFAFGLQDRIVKLEKQLTQKEVGDNE